MILDSGLSSGVFGLQKAQSAEKIVNASAAPAVSFEKSLTADETANANGLNAQSNVVSTVLPQTDVVAEVVTMNVAAQAYKANLAAIKTWDSMTRAMLNVTHKPTDEKV